MQAYYYNADQVQQILGVSRSKAYQIIRELNDELRKKGYLVTPGKISRKYMEEKCYGLTG